MVAFLDREGSLGCGKRFSQNDESMDAAPFHQICRHPKVGGHGINRPPCQTIKPVLIVVDQYQPDAWLHFQKLPRKSAGRHAHAPPFEIAFVVDGHLPAAHHESKLPGEGWVRKVEQPSALVRNAQSEQPVCVAL